METPDNGKVFKQDLSQEAKFSGVYAISLLFREKCGKPSTDALLEKLKTKFGGVDLVSDSALSAFALTEHLVTYNEGQRVPSQLLITECAPVKKPFGDAIARTQFWNCQNGVELLDSCPWQVMIGDFMAAGLPALERADVLSDWLEIALELYPTCEAVFFQASGKLLTADKARENPYSGSLRLIWGGVNARLFNIEGAGDMVVDTLGLYALGLPDVQYHFRILDPNDVVHHANNTAIYQLENNVPIESGHTIEGIEPGSRWRCQYENSLIQPARVVLDVAAGEFAAGNRT